MDRMIIMFPAKAGMRDVVDAFADEYAVVQRMSFFDIVLFDFDSAVEAGELILSRQPENPKAPMMYRGPRLSIAQYKELFSAAKAADYRMITNDWQYGRLHRFAFDNGHVVGETHRDTPESRDVSWNHSWYTGYGNMHRCLLGEDRSYAKAPNSRGRRRIAKDLDADSRVVAEFDELTREFFDGLRTQYLREDDYGLYRNLIIQEYVELKRYDGATNEWRGRFFDGQLFELLPNSGQPDDAPQPPQWMIDKHKSESPYYELDFAEVYDGDWLILGSDDGQVAKRAIGQSAEDYYASLERVARESPHLPEWIWCLVANVAEDATYTRKDGTVGKGTKHFSPGTKIYIGSTWHGSYGDLKFVVMGKPRHQRRLIQIYMGEDKLCNFRLKKVYDKRVIEHMTRFDRGMLRLGASPEVHGGWDNTDESKKEIEEWAELLTRAYNERHAEAREGAFLEEGPS